MEEKKILEKISEEIERRFNCKVMAISMSYILGTPNVQCKISYNDDFVYKPCEHWEIKSIVFSEKSVTFFRRIDFFECMKNVGSLN